MSGQWRTLRGRVLTPNESETRLDVRGFHVKNPEARDLLETVGRSFLTGYRHAVEARSAAEVRRRLDPIAPRFRGFAYEGAAMGLGVLDGLTPGRRRLDGFLDGPGRDHVYMAYVGMGWAMARLPRFRWSRIPAADPLLRWLALDGYGFHQAYFRTRRYVHEQFTERTFPWPAGGHGGYASRAIDQGIGRALWFVCGTEPGLVADTIEGFPAHRRPDLYAGTGLAATYAGGADESELCALWDRAGEHRPLLAQGSAFAAEARLRASVVVPHVGLATRVLCGMTPEDASRVCAERRPAGPIDPDEDARATEPAYELWRRDIAEQIMSHHG